MIQNNKGFSLIEVVIAMGVLGLVSLGTVKIMNMTMQNEKSSDIKSEVDQIFKDIKMKMQNPIACTNTFSGFSHESSFNQLSTVKNLNNEVIYNTGIPLAKTKNKLVQISSIEILGKDNDGVNTKFDIQVEFDLTNGGKNTQLIGAKILKRQFSIYAKKNCRQDNFSSPVSSGPKVARDACRVTRNGSLTKGLVINGLNYDVSCEICDDTNLGVASQIKECIAGDARDQFIEDACVTMGGSYHEAGGNSTCSRVEIPDDELNLIKEEVCNTSGGKFDTISGNCQLIEKNCSEHAVSPASYNPAGGLTAVELICPGNRVAKSGYGNCGGSSSKAIHGYSKSIISTSSLAEDNKWIVLCYGAVSSGNYSITCCER
ncbi:MAG: prepilin-type N-terminal cleavage/methylation domain-containing protein [Bacteriovoracaceae bacterium]|jgi:prepilin-type N-terminal cleavage/methylation domain-containing protein|nr:prepilin-type N-terminal cleavage/methylation domain-containing protein [Bacteriovoracaceae bacterium]